MRYQALVLATGLFLTITSSGQMIAYDAADEARIPAGGTYANIHTSPDSTG